MATAKQVASRTAFASAYAHSKSRAHNQIKNVPKQMARKRGKNG